VGTPFPLLVFKNACTIFRPNTLNMLANSNLHERNADYLLYLIMELPSSLCSTNRLFMCCI